MITLIVLLLRRIRRNLVANISNNLLEVYQYLSILILPFLSKTVNTSQRYISQGSLKLPVAKKLSSVHKKVSRSDLVHFQGWVIPLKIQACFPALYTCGCQNKCQSSQLGPRIWNLYVVHSRIIPPALENLPPDCFVTEKYTCSHFSTCSLRYFAMETQSIL